MTTRIRVRTRLTLAATRRTTGQRSPLPVCVLLENVRSLYNVGAFFRTADAVALETFISRASPGIPRRI